MPDRGKRARATMFPSIDPSTIQIPPSRGFSPKRPPQRCQFQLSIIALQAAESLVSWSASKGPEANTASATPPSPDHRFESNSSSVLAASLVSSQSDRSEGSSIPNMTDDVGRPEPVWRLIYPSLKTRMHRMPSSTRVGGGIWLYTIMWGAGIAPSFHTPSGLCKGTLEN